MPFFATFFNKTVQVVKVRLALLINWVLAMGLRPIRLASARLRTSRLSVLVNTVIVVAGMWIVRNV